MNTVIKTISQLKDAEVNAYIYSVIIAVVFILLLIIVANMISWKPGAKDNSGETRRTFFWLFLALSLIVSVVVNFFVFYQEIAVAHFKSEFMMHMGIAGFCCGLWNYKFYYNQNPEEKYKTCIYIP